MPALTFPTMFKNFSIDSTVELTSDYFRVTVLGLDLFLNAAITDQLNIQAGLKDPAGGPDQTITAIGCGPIDEYELVITPTSQVLNLRGRDEAAFALDSVFNKKYIFADYQTDNQLRVPVGAPVGVASLQQQFTNVTQSQIAAAQSQQADESKVGLPVTPFVVGVFSASQIATEAAAEAGLSLSWEVRDYTLKETFTASGSVISTIKKMIEPWVQVEPFRADIIMNGTTMIIRYRQLPGASISPQYTLALRDARRSQLTIRKRRARKVRLLTLLGQKVPVTGLGTPGVTVIPGATRDTVRQETLTTDPNGKQIKTVTTTTFLFPGQLVVDQVKDVFAPFQIEHTETHNIWEEDFTGPRMRQSDTIQSTFDEGIGSLIESAEITKRYLYEAQGGFLQQETEIASTLDQSTGTMAQSAMTIKTLSEHGPLLVEEVTERYSFNRDVGQWDQISRDSQLQGGHRPGGTGRSIFIAKGATNLAPIKLVKALNTTDSFGANVQYSNPHLTLSDLQFLQSLFIAANNFVFEYEIMFQGVAMPWIQRGVTIQFINIFGPDGVTAIPLAPAFVTEVRTNYDESKVEATYVSDARAFTWV